MAAGWLALAALSLAARAQPAPTERQVKAAFLFRFAEYVEWPASAFADDAAAVTIAVLGDERLAEDLRRFAADRRIDGRPVEVRTVTDGQSTKGMHVLYIARPRHTALAHAADRDDPILVVTEVEDALSHGATINFVLDGARVGFEVSLEDAQRRQLKLSSRLLSVARNVRRTAG